MKLTLTGALLASFMLAACVTDPASRDCSTITDQNFRDQCLARSIQNAQREAQEAAEEAATETQANKEEPSGEAE